MNLTDRERSILFAAQLNARGSMREIGKAARVPPHTARYALRQLSASGRVFVVPLVNVFALGLSQYIIYFSINSVAALRSKEFMTTLLRSSRVAWVGELGGEYQYGMTINAAGLRDLIEFLDTLASQFDGLFHKKVVHQQVSFTYFRKRFLALRPQSAAPAMLSLHQSDRVVSLDVVDRSLVALLCRDGAVTIRDAARVLKLPRATVNYRVRRLEEWGVIVGYVYALLNFSFNLLSFKIQIYVRGPRQKFKEKLFQFCAEQVATAGFIHCLGSWDFEINLDVERVEDATAYVRALNQTFPENILDLKLVPVFQQRISESYLAEG